MRSEPGRAGRVLGVLYLALCILAVLALLIHSVPEDKRQTGRLMLLRLSARAMSGLARHAGAASMRRELVTGREDYATPYGLARVALRLDGAYWREAAR
jgi:hypothetical protein